MVKERLKKNWLSLTAILLATIAICLTIVRVDPINFDDGSMVTLVVGLMGVCATIMVASQIIGLRASEDKIKSMIEKESVYLREISSNNMIRALYRVEIIAITSIVQMKLWEVFIIQIEKLESYATALKDEKMATETANLLIKTEETFHFLMMLSASDEERLNKCVFALIKLVDNPSKLISTFINNDEDTTKQ